MEQIGSQLRYESDRTSALLMRNQHSFMSLIHRSITKTEHKCQSPLIVNSVLKKSDPSGVFLTLQREATKPSMLLSSLSKETLTNNNQSKKLFSDTSSRELCIPMTARIVYVLKGGQTIHDGRAQYYTFNMTEMLDNYYILK